MDHRESRSYSVSCTTEQLALRKAVHLLTNLPGHRPSRLGLQKGQLSKHLFTVIPLTDAEKLQLIDSVKSDLAPEIALLVRLDSLNLTANVHNHLTWLQAELGLAKAAAKTKSTTALFVGRKKQSSCELTGNKQSSRVKPRIDHLYNAAWQFDETFVFRGVGSLTSGCLEVKFYNDSTSSNDSAQPCFTSTVPLKDLSYMGCTNAKYNVMVGRGSKTKIVGSCFMDVQLVLANSLSSDASSSAELDEPLSVSYGTMYDILFSRVLQYEQSRLSISGNDVYNYIEHFSLASKNLLGIIESFAYFSPLEVKLFRLSRFLILILEQKLQDCHPCICSLVATLKQDTVKPSADGDTTVSSLRHFNITSLFDAIERYVIYKLQEFQSLHSLFPISEEDFADWQKKLSCLCDLLAIEDYFRREVRREVCATTKSKLVSHLTQRIQSDAKDYIIQRIGELKCQERKEFVLQDIDYMIELFDELKVIMDKSSSIDGYFLEQIGMHFCKTVIFSIDSQLMSHTKELMAFLNAYQSRYQSYMSNITDSSKRSLKLYLSIKRFTSTCRTYIPDREIFKFSLCHPAECFADASIFWLQTFKMQSQFRIRRALEIEKDIVEIDANVKVSNSVVDVLAVFYKIISEWNEIDLVDRLDNVFGALKMTDCICDGICFYAKKVCEILEANSYFDKRGQQFDVSDQLCISLNNIEHARKFLHNLSSQFTWEESLELVVLPRDADDIRDRFMSAMQSVIDDANDYVLLKCRKIEKQVAERLQRDIKKHTVYFTQRAPDKRGSIDNLLGYLNTNLSMFADKLEQQICPRMFSAVWSGVLLAFSNSLLRGEKPTYYEMMLKHLSALKSFFQHRGLIEEVLTGDSTFFLLSESLLQNSKPTERLLLEFYSKAIQCSIGTPSNYLGHLTVKAGLIKQSNGMLTLNCLIVNCQYLPGSDKNGLSDPYVIASLKPETMFTESSQFRTEVQLQSVNPIFMHEFSVSSIPVEFADEIGCCVQFLVMDHEFLRPDRCIGEVFFSLTDFDEVSSKSSWETYPAFMKSIRRPVLSIHPTCEDIVHSRSAWDKAAELFYSSRQQLRHRCSPVRSQSSRRNSSVFSFRRVYDKSDSVTAKSQNQQQQQQQQQEPKWRSAWNSLLSEMVDICETTVCCRQSSVNPATSVSTLAWD